MCLHLSSLVVQLIVLNRQNLNNMMQPITAVLKTRLVEPYLMFQSSEPCVCGTEESTVTHGNCEASLFFPSSYSAYIISAVS
jgi:Dcp1-like decapping family